MVILYSYTILPGRKYWHLNTISEVILWFKTNRCIFHWFQFVAIEVIISGITDMSGTLLKHKSLLTALTCVLLFFLGLPMVTNVSYTHKSFALIAQTATTIHLVTVML